MGLLRKIFGLAPEVDFEQLIAGGAIIVDVRSKGEYSSGHVKGSLNIPLDQVADSLNKLKDKEQVIITCCASGMRSGVAKKILKNAGYNNVYNGGPWQRLSKYGK